MEVDVSECENQEEWNALVARSLKPTFFHTWEWLKFAEEHSGFRLHPLIAKLGTNAIGILPIFSKTQKKLKIFSSPPPKALTPYLGLLMVPYDKILKQQTVEKTVLSCIDTFDGYLCGKYKPGRILVSNPPGYGDARPFLWNGYTLTPRYTYVLDLEGRKMGEEPPQIRQPLSEAGSITVKEGGKTELGTIFDSVSASAEMPEDYLNDVYDRFHPKSLRITVAEQAGLFAGALVTVHHGDRVTCLLEVNGKKPDDVDAFISLHRDAICWAVKHGYMHYDLGDAGAQETGGAKARLNPQLAIRFQAEKCRPKYLALIR